MRVKHILTVIVLVAMLSSCKQPGSNSTGSEYMPDMAHSIAYEANYYNYYYNNTWDGEDDYYQYALPKTPVNGTVPRTGTASNMRIPGSGSVPYYYDDSEEGRAQAMAQIVNNPFPITEAGLAEGKELYKLYCAICHGDKGDGGGYLVRDDGGVYPVQPANFLLDEFVTASNGRYYHSIMRGRNLMGAYADKLAYSERWQVIHYIRSLQAKDKGLVYNQMENTLNAVDKPAGDLSKSMIGMADDHHDEEHGSHDGDHNHDHDGTDGDHHDHDHEGHHDSDDH